MLIKFKKLKKSSQTLDEEWKNIKVKNRNFTEITKFNISSEHNFKLTQQTLSDIEIFDLFEYLDRTHTAIGEQYLFYTLCNPTIDINELSAREKLKNEFINNKNNRNYILSLFKKLNKTGSNKIIDLINESPSFFYKNYFQYLTLISIFSLPCIILFHKTAIFFLFLFGVNLIFHLIYRFKNSKFYLEICQLSHLISITKDIINNISIKNISQPDISLHELESLNKSYKLISLLRPTNDFTNILYYFIDLIKAYFLIEPHLFNNAYYEIIKHRNDIVNLYVFIGKIEVAISTSAIWFNNSSIISTPYFTDKFIFKIYDGLHPYLKECEPNTLIIEDKNIFLTGSNMSGKSTFLRMILINSILAQTLNICFAKKFETSIKIIYSSIKIVDDISNNSSFYYSEMNVIKQMVNSHFFNLPRLIVIDEIFKGTNRIERISISASILSYLCKSNSLIVASSHDTEIIKFLPYKYESYYFSDEYIEGEFVFDYKIKKGILTATNAIRILELEDYPQEIINQAYKISNTIN